MGFKRRLLTKLRVDPKFKYKLVEVPGGETFKLCYHCGTCTATCPASSFIDVFRPNKIIYLAKLGIRNAVYSDAFWLCAACDSCKSCPQGVKIVDVMHALKILAVEEGYTPDILINEFEETLKEIPFPVVYSWLCFCPCEEESKRSKFDNVVLDALQRSLAAHKKLMPLPKKRREKIAIIGSGPAGLTAAWELTKMGFPVTVFESLSEPGGMLRVGIPQYRLPKEILDAEIQHIKDLGVEIRTNTTVDKDLFNNILKEYKAIFIATGAHKGRKVRVEGEDMEGVVHALELLRQINLQGKARLGKKVIVIGGGGVAIDVARTALRFGAEVVQLVCLEPREEMPAHEWEIREALIEGVVLNVSWGAKRILGDGKKVTGVEFTRCVSVFDEEGRFHPSFDETATKVLGADTVILAIGQTPDLSFLEKKIDINPITMETNLPGVFAGGDAVSGSASVVEAIAAGKMVAASIDRYLRGINLVDKSSRARQNWEMALTT